MSRTSCLIDLLPLSPHDGLTPYPTFTDDEFKQKAQNRKEQVRNAGEELQAEVLGGCMTAITKSKSRATPPGVNGANGGGAPRRSMSYHREATEMTREALQVMKAGHEKDAEYKQKLIQIEEREVKAREKEAEAKLLEAQTHQQEVQLRKEEAEERKRETQARDEQMRMMMMVLKDMMEKINKN